jgi:hypothetical protein
MTHYPDPPAHYDDQEERDAWSRGHDDARRGLPMDAATRWPNAYAAGFWTGNQARVDRIRGTR